MKKNDNTLYFLLVFVLLFCAVFGLANSLKSDKNLTAEQIYSNALKSVVEVKATTENVGESFGSAVFVLSEGKLVTNAHVVTYKQSGVTTEFENISIRFAFENDYRSVSLEKYDSELDIAILKLDDTNCDFEPVEFADSYDCKAGNKVYAVGNLNNVGISLTQGVISNASINVEYNSKTKNVIQCDLTIAEGNSGGALLNDKGRLLGITTFRLKDSSKNVIYGICYCVPANAVAEYINK